MSVQRFRRFGLLAAALLACSSFAVSQGSDKEMCPRAAAGSVVTSPAELSSDHGTLTATLSFRSDRGPDGQRRYCYMDGDGHQAPTLRVHPGDQVNLRLKNDIAAASSEMASHAAVGPGDCGHAQMSADSTNLHFHGLSIPPACHQDESLSTLIQPAGPAFEYQFRIPKSQSPGLYWYHPHVHGSSEAQVMGGASGALIVEGTEQTDQMLPERVLVIRDQKPAATGEEAGQPAKDLSVNFVPVPYPDYPMAVIRSKPSRRELWRVLNGCADTYLDLGVLFNGKWRDLGLVGVDGAPIGRGQGHTDGIAWRRDIPIPPGGRAEFIFETPAEHVNAELLTLGVLTSPPSDEDDPAAVTSRGQAAALDDDDANPPRQLAKIISSAEATEPGNLAAVPGLSRLSADLGLARARPIRKRLFYFSEQVLDPKHPASSTVYYITEKGSTPKAFDLAAGPNITVQSGDVEDWVIENRSQESHAFHIHQLHFLTLERNGSVTRETYLRDTIDVPYWDGTSRRFPSVKLRMDFRDPDIVGKIPYHCHVLQHADGGMMGVVEVKPRVPGFGRASRPTTQAEKR